MAKSSFRTVDKSLLIFFSFNKLLENIVKSQVLNGSGLLGGEDKDSVCLRLSLL